MSDIILWLALVILALAAAHALWLRFQYHVRERNRHPHFREFLRSRALQHALDVGATGRGREQKVRKRAPWWRAPWLEFCLRLRVARDAGLGVLTLRGKSAPVGRLFVRVRRRDGTVEDHGLVSTKVVTDAGVAAMVDAFQDSFELETFKYHGIGTDSTTEAAGDTALGTEVETRATGTTTEGASANIYRTVGEVTTASARAVVEHGIFSASSSGTLLDRSVFSVINTGAGDSIEFTYELTIPAGS